MTIFINYSTCTCEISHGSMSRLRQFQ